MLNHIIHPAHELKKSDIAKLSNEEIWRLDYEEMIDLVLASEMPVRNVESIRTFEGETVSRLAWMARNHCRKDIAAG